MAPPNSTFASELLPAQRSEVIRDIHRKHAAELLALEEAQQKVVLLLLGVFGAGASFIASDRGPSLQNNDLLRGGLTVLVLALLAIAAVYTHHRNGSRKAVRHLLLQCDEALGLFEPGIYLEGAHLYANDFREFPKVGGWLGWTYWLAFVAGIGFIIVLWTVGR
jgi:hypothetical protein